MEKLANEEDYNWSHLERSKETAASGRNSSPSILQSRDRRN